MYSLWFDPTENPSSTALKASMLTVTPLMHLTQVNNKYVSNWIYVSHKIFVSVMTMVTKHKDLIHLILLPFPAF
jgi:pyocin large subunit-like protein